MNNSSLNIVELMENNPITRLSNNYQGSLLTKIKERFTDNEQQMFVSSFYCYLNYNQKTDFIIDLDSVWKWIGFSQKYNAKYMLEKQFIIDTDYKLFAPEHSGAKKDTRGGHNKETIMLTVRTFKLFCLKACTKKAEQIHNYYITLEDTLQEIIQEESNELKLQLEQKTNELYKQVVQSEHDKDILREKTLLEQFPNNTQCIYYGFIDNLSDNNERLIKFGNSNCLKNRITQHKKTYLNFRLVNVFKVDNKLQIENAIKEHTLFKERQRTITLCANSKKFIELLNIDGLIIDDLDKTIKEIITSLEYSPENYLKILNENQELKYTLEQAKQINNTDSVYVLQTENSRLKLENIKLIKRYQALSKKTNQTVNEDNMVIETDIKPQLITNEDVNNYGNVIITLKKNMKSKAADGGMYDIGNKKYELLKGTRQEVLDGKAYKTTGGLLKHNLLINKHGLIVSKRKSMTETVNKRLFVCGVNK